MSKKITLTAVKNANGTWFSPDNKKFFGDLNYSVITDNEGDAYLVQETEGWTDMFGGLPRVFFKVRPINGETLILGRPFEQEFKTIEDVEEYLDPEEDNEEITGTA